MQTRQVRLVGIGDRSTQLGACSAEKCKSAATPTGPPEPVDFAGGRQDGEPVIIVQRHGKAQQCQLPGQQCLVVPLRSVCVVVHFGRRNHGLLWRASQCLAASNQEISGLPALSISSSRRSCGKIVAQPSGQTLFAYRSAASRDQNRPPDFPFASRATQKPL